MRCSPTADVRWVLAARYAGKSELLVQRLRDPVLVVLRCAWDGPSDPGNIALIDLVRDGAQTRQQHFDVAGGVRGRELVARRRRNYVERRFLRRERPAEGGERRLVSAQEE